MNCMNKPIPIKDPIQHGTDDFNFSIYHHYAKKGHNLFFGNHWHPEYEIIYVKSGSLIFEIDGKNYSVSNNQALIINRYQIHSWLGVHTSPFHFAAIVFGNSFLFPDPHSFIYKKYIHSEKGELSLQTQILGKDNWEKEILLILHKICSTADLQNLGYELELQIQLLRIFNIMITNDACIYLSDPHDVFRTRIRDILYYMHENYQQDLKISALAQSMYMSTEHFIRSFKKVTGKSPKRYLLDYRLQCVISQLIESDEKIAAIAEACGFSDMSYFSRIFKAYTGKTPSEYRKLKRGLYSV